MIRMLLILALLSAVIQAESILKKKYDYRTYLEYLRSDNYRIGGQFAYDMAYVDVEPEGYGDSRFRRVRLFQKGNFFDNTLFFENEYEFEGDNNYKDNYIGYKNSLRLGKKINYRFRFGNIKVPFSLESYSPSKHHTFMERSLSEAFVEDRKVGGELLLTRKKKDYSVNLFAGLYNNSINERIDGDKYALRYATRLTYAQKYAKNHLLHVGAAYMHSDLDGANLRYSRFSESDLMKEKYASVRVRDVDTVDDVGVEFLYINRRISLQAEYIYNTVKAQRDTYSFSGYYAQASYFLMGAKRKYKLTGATLAPIKPNSKTALEFALRYSEIDLDDKDEKGGKQHDITYGVNWYITDEIKVMGNYVVAMPKSDRYDGLLQVFQARLYFIF